jgi:hypothetical protein
MKTAKSRRTLAGWALAGTLGLTGPAAAQVSSYQASSPPAAAPAAAPAQADALVRLEAIQIELAWLADPVTFPYNLGVYPAGPTFEVRGFVPSDAVRAQALKAARALTKRTVTDGVKVYPGMLAPSAGETPEALHKAASEAVIQAMGDRGRGVSVQAQAGGQVTLTGTAACHEEKLAVSRQLRRVRGCTSVVNELNVVTVLRDGKLYYLVSADGQHRVPAHTEILHVNHTTPSKPASPSTPPAVAAKPAVPPVSQPSATKSPAPLQLISFQKAAPTAPAPPTKASTGPRVVMVKTLEGVPGSPLPVERLVPVLLSGTSRMQATRPLSDEELATLQAQGVPIIYPRGYQPPPTAKPPADPVTRAEPPHLRPAPAPTKPQPAPVTTSPPKPAENVARKPAAPPVIKPVENVTPRPTEKPTPAVPPKTAITPAPATLPVIVTQPPAAKPAPAPLPTVVNQPKPAAPPTPLPVVQSSRPLAEKKEPIPLPVVQNRRPTRPAKPTMPRSTVEPPLAPPLEPAPTSPASEASVAPAVHKAAPAPATNPQAGAVVSTQKPAAAAPVGTPSKPPAESKPAVPAAPYVTTGVVTFEEEPPAQPAPPPAPPSAVPAAKPGTTAMNKINLAQLRSRISKVCGGKVRDVEVVVRGENNLRIQLKVASADEAPRVSEKILNLPELGPYEVALDVQVAP